MRQSFTHVLGWLVVAACLSATPPAIAQDSPIVRHSADFFKFDGSEFFTTTGAVSGPNVTVPGSPDGAVFYVKKIAVPAISNVLYVSIDATGDGHFGAALWLSCRVNNAFCRPSTVPAVDKAPSGWIALLKLPQDVQAAGGANNCNDGGGGSADCHDNGIAYQWCIPVRGGGGVVVVLKMATSKPGSPVFMEKGHVFVDSSRIAQPDRCLNAPTVAAAALREFNLTGAAAVIAGSTRQKEK